jgi:ABC-type multidrug transport system ATPase subunit
MDPAVSLRSAVALLGRFPALAGVDLDVQPGEVVLLRGPNGAGKSTLLRVCAGLVPLTEGEGTVLGVDLRGGAGSLRRRVGLLAHANGLYDDLTVAAAPGEVAEALAHLGLDGRLATTGVAKLSAGQRRRTALAAMLVRRPELWLLDEPHAGLDAEGRDLLDALVRRAAAAGATVLVASHELDRAGTLAGRMVTVVGGRIVADEVVTPTAPSPGPA